MNIRATGAELFHGDRRMDSQWKKTKLIATSRHCTKAPTVQYRHMPYVRPSGHSENSNMHIAHDCGLEADSNVHSLSHCTREKKTLSTKSTAALNTSPIISQGEVSNCYPNVCSSSKKISQESYQFPVCYVRLCGCAAAR
jgi:hypothetical protein